MTSKDVKAIRDRLRMYLTPEVANRAGLTIWELQQFIAGSYTPSETQLVALARRMGLS